MTRRLPWGCDDDAPVRTPVKKNTTSNPSRKEVTPSRASGTPKPKATPTPRESSNRPSARPNGSHRDRSLSTSPPPQPLPETPMIEGLENDDQYRMVEDEFFTVAGQFTAHLHAAEYHRLKTQTKAQNAETINSISRPVVGSLTELARRRQEELLRKKKQREALRNAKKDAGIDDESGDETMPWNGSSLQGLMDSPQKKEVPLTALTRTSSGTGASSLFGGIMKPQNKRPAVRPCENRRGPWCLPCRKTGNSPEVYRAESGTTIQSRQRRDSTSKLKTYFACQRATHREERKQVIIDQRNTTNNDNHNRQ
ncbi:hypothetical protein CkaCkLH20_00807 [Colletotrichum karsti]|uniref:Uncharacterized protein n=1 Tax=Colletotrichum karsti TaxID=1095194 RepID=A0A9P6IIA9_9PEZI|nr:uncharacterized protein CkaCkLH20_00807 [Colletotrichum karsti]KAF9881661.1 hypothetical protein CkaCkLH20_00807 [Colletotrichum karsti]